MKITEMQTQSVKVVVKTTCDICGAEKGGSGWSLGPSYKVSEVTIQHERGERYPEFAHGDRLELDICPSCFEGKVMPALRSLGVQTAYTEWEW